MPPTRPVRKARFDHGLRRQAIVRTLLNDVFQGRVRAGGRLVTDAIAARFGVSHTPIREAIIELAGLGVVDLLPNRGAVVRPVTTRTVQEVCEVRRALECEAVRGACGLLDRATVELLVTQTRAVLVTEPGPGLVLTARDLDTRLHDLIALGCGNAFLAAELARLKMLFRAFRDVAWEQEEAREDFGRLPIEAGEHLNVLLALLDNDPDRAVAAMATHIRSGIHYWGRITAHLSDEPKGCER